MYTLKLTEQEITTINFVGERYGWSAILGKMRRLSSATEDNTLEEGTELLELEEHEAWELKKAFEEDALLFPMLDERSDLYRKLMELYNQII